jgi:hypothetical protein
VSEEKEICFVIMPFSQTISEHTEEYWTEHFERFLKPLIEENQTLEAHRSKPLRGDILREIITDLVTSRVVVADLTDLNPNVFWELGVRQSFKHGTITIVDPDTKLPFDVDKKGTLRYYPENHLKMETFRNDFKEAIADCLSNPKRPDSQVLETLSGRGSLFEIFNRDEAIRRLDAVLAECDWNTIVGNHAVSQAKENQENPEKRNFVTRRFRTSAVELLVTNRYIDEEPGFFDDAEFISDLCCAANEMLNGWQYDPNRNERWFLRNENLLKKTPQGFKKALNKLVKI